MPIQNGEYVAPQWTNNAPPPLGQDNLNDISEALEALNIPSDIRTELLSTDSDSIGTILKNIKDYAVSYEEGSYTGTGNYSSAHPTMISIPRNSDGDIGFGMVIGQGNNGWGVFTKYSGYFLDSSTVDKLNMLYSSDTSNMSIRFYSSTSAKNQLNASNVIYRYIVFHN